MGNAPRADQTSPQPRSIGGSESPESTFIDSDGEEHEVYSDGAHERQMIDESDVSQL